MTSVGELNCIFPEIHGQGLKHHTQVALVGKVPEMRNRMLLVINKNFTTSFMFIQGDSKFAFDIQRAASGLKNFVREKLDTNPESSSIMSKGI